MDFAVPATPANKESEKRDKYLDLARELHVTVIPIVISTLGTVPKT